MRAELCRAIPRLRRLLKECPGLELRLATGTDYTKFLADEFDADIFYSLASSDGSQKQGLIMLPLGSEIVTPLCAPSIASTIPTPADLLRRTLIESDNTKVRWPAWFAANGLVAPLPKGPRFDRSFMSLSGAVDEIGVALESTLLAEREIASDRLMRLLHNKSGDVSYTGHWLVFPRSGRYSWSMVMFINWLTKEVPSPFAVQLCHSLKLAHPNCGIVKCTPAIGRNGVITDQLIDP